MGKRASGEGTIKKRKDGRWVGLVSFGYRPDGKRDRRAVYGKTQAEVKDKIKGLIADKDRLKTPQDLTLADFYPEWLRTKIRVSERTRELYEYSSRHLMPVLGKVKISKLNIRDVERMILEVSETHSPHAASKCRMLLKQIMDKAVAWDYAVKNPVIYTEAPKLKAIEPRVWSLAEVLFFLGTIEKHPYYPALYLIVALGLRRGEALGLHWYNVSPDSIRIGESLTQTRGKLSISAPKTEAGYRTIPIAPDVYNVLTAHREKQILIGHYNDRGLVFKSEVGTPISPRNFIRGFKLLQDKAKLRYLTEAYEVCDEAQALEALDRINTGRFLQELRLHDLRHTHISLSVNASDISLSELAKRVGHARVSYTLDIYTHVLPNRDTPRASLEALKVTN